MTKFTPLALCVCLLAIGCDPPDGRDAGTLDGASMDSGPGTTDAGNTDAGNADAGNTDAGNADAGNTDAGAGIDGGADACGDAGPSPDSTCEQYARHVCSPPECPERRSQHTFGGEDRCVAAVTQSCVAATQVGSNITAGDLDRCAGPIACGAEITDPCCLALTEIDGDRALDAPCVATNQCGTHEGRRMICRSTTPFVQYAVGLCEPGRCTPMLREGEACDAIGSICGPGTRCIDETSGSVCRVVVRDQPLGAACAALETCAAGLRCNRDDRCAAYVPEGGACELLEFGDCSPGLGLTCRDGSCTYTGGLIGDACGPDVRCPLSGSECRDGICVDISQPAGGACSSLVDCEFGLGCDMNICRNVSCDP